MKKENLVLVDWNWSISCCKESLVSVALDLAHWYVSFQAEMCLVHR
jgi:hypothetical protein